VRPLLGQVRSTISLREILDDGKWFIVNISRDRLKESRRLLGSLLVALLHQAALSREHVPPDQRIFHAVWVDECAEFWAESFLSVLEGGRKFGLALAILHQNLSQPPLGHDPTIVDTILANTHCQIAFNAPRRDAERLSRELFHATAAETKYQRHFLGIPIEQPQFWSLGDERENYVAELMRQQVAEAHVRFKGIGDDEPYVCRIPHVPDVPINPEKVDVLRRHVARRYYRPVDIVEEEIRQRWASLGLTSGQAGRVARDFFR